MHTFELGVSDFELIMIEFGFGAHFEDMLPLTPFASQRVLDALPHNFDYYALILT